MSAQPGTRKHPEIHEQIWHNHADTFHLSQAEGGYARIHRLRPT